MSVKGPNIDRDILSEKFISSEGFIDAKNQKSDYYFISSAGMEVGNSCSIKINDKEYAINNRGLNIVVYDIIYHFVIDSVCFDTYEGLVCSR